MDSNLAPTKSNLISYKNSLKLAKDGYMLLDRKRNVLIREMMDMIDKAKEVQKKVSITFGEAYKALQLANITMGISTVDQIASSISEDLSLDVKLRSVMGVEIPAVRGKVTEDYPIYGYFRTNSALDVAYSEFQKVKILIFQMAEIETSIYRLAFEIKKTQKRANALQNILIPRYEAIVKYIQEVLEEKEREDFFRLKKIKKNKR